MSPEAVARRLEEAAQLHELWLSLRRARVLGPVKPPAGEPDPARGSPPPIR